MTYLDEFQIFPPASHRCPDPVHIRFLVDQMTGFFPSTSVSCWQYRSTSDAYSSSSAGVIRATSGRNLETFEKSVLSEDWEHSNEKVVLV